MNQQTTGVVRTPSIHDESGRADEPRIEISEFEKFGIKINSAIAALNKLAKEHSVNCRHEYNIINSALMAVGIQVSKMLKHDPVGMLKTVVARLETFRNSQHGWNDEDERILREAQEVVAEIEGVIANG